MSNPMKPALHQQWREWASGFKSSSGGVRVKYVFGNTIYQRHNDQGELTAKDPEFKFPASGPGSDDFLFVAGRESLPHVGKVTEKSAYFWQMAVTLDPNAKWFCKCDDDTLVHLDRLESTLRFLEKKLPGQNVYTGHIKWRGWDVGNRFQACGGTWGDARKAANDILYGGLSEADWRQKRFQKEEQNCPHAAGPFPYMSGGMYCMSRPLAERMHTDPHFLHFMSVARARNTLGSPCDRPSDCAAQSAETHMWHHEDAGIGYNVFRAVVAHNASLTYIPVPGHFADALSVERSSPLTANDEYWSSRAIFTHGIKSRALYRTLRERWNLTRPQATLELNCFPCNELPEGTNGHHGHWEWARVPCPGTDDGRAQILGVGRFCDAEPHKHFEFCTFPWTIPKKSSSHQSSVRKHVRPYAKHLVRKFLRNGKMAEQAEEGLGV